MEDVEEIGTLRGGLDFGEYIIKIINIYRSSDIRRQDHSSVIMISKSLLTLVYNCCIIALSQAA